MSVNEPITVYELSCNLQIQWQAHSLSNAGSQQSNRMLPRQQLLSDGCEVDAISGNILKQHHASLTAEYLDGYEDHLCSACAVGDARRAGQAVELGKAPSMETVLQCGMCDTHGFLITGKKGTDATVERSRRAKPSIVEFSMALALPEYNYASQQIFTRNGRSNDGADEEGQMIYKVPARSGRYALIVRFTSANIGVDTDSRRLVITDNNIRAKRHKAVLLALRDLFLSPSGAATAKLLPHTSGLSGAIVVRTAVGRAPTYSPLEADCVDTLDELCKLEAESCLMYKIKSIVDFSQCISELAANSTPFRMPVRYSGHI